MKAIDLATKNLTRCDALIEVHRIVLPRGRQVPHGETADILRAVIVLAVATMDSYFHKKIIETVEDSVKNKKDISTSCSNIVAENFPKEIRNQRLLSFLQYLKPHKEIAKILSKQIDQRTFQNPEDLSKAFDIMDVKEPWKKINRLMSRGRGKNRTGRFSDVRNFIKEVGKRRNRIVHESDMYTSRRSHSKLRPITRSYVESVVRKISSFLKQVEIVTRTISAGSRA